MKRDVFIGGAWPYANYFMHIGHLAALLPGDIIAKYYRIHGDNVIYVSGSDCHGTPITQRANSEGVTPEQIANYYHEEFVQTFNKMNFEYDEYGKTSEPYHEDLVQKYFITLKDNGYIFEQELPQDYCETCNNFLSDREIIGECPICHGESTGDQCEECLASLNSNDVLNKRCKKCGNASVMKDNKHLYFKLTAFKDDLQKLIDDNKTTWRKNALGEAQKYLDMGLVDRAATRQIDWGVKVPVDGYEDKRIYVWIEAVLGYLTMGKKVADQKKIDFDSFMSNNNDNLRTYYIHGKDNIPFHTTIFPALLKGLKNDYRLPDYIVSSAYIVLNNEKMSKSKGNLITVNELLETFTSDTLRFYFTMNGPETKDSSCSIEDIIQDHNKFLVGVLGNFVNRNLSFIFKKFNGIIPQSNIDQTIKKYTEIIYDNVGKSIENGELKLAINQVFEYISLGNKYYDERQPWIQAKEDLDEFHITTYTCVYMMANIANLIYPFLPNASLKLLKQLELTEPKWEEVLLDKNLKLEKVELLFNKIED